MLGAHCRLLAGTSLAGKVGRIRKVQNSIGLTAGRARLACPRVAGAIAPTQ